MEDANAIIVSATNAESERLFDDFLFLLKDDESFDHALRTRREVHFKDGTVHRFICRNKVREQTEGFHGRVLNEEMFRFYMDEFKNHKSEEE